MVLFVNVFLTDKVLNVYYHGRRVALQNKVDIFKYTLASYAVIPWEHVVIYLKLDPIYEGRRAELEGYIKGLFPEVIYHPFRNEKQVEWRKAMTELFSLNSDGLVWFTCNDDHVFVDYDLEGLNQVTKGLTDLQNNHLRVAAAISHWPEYVPYIQQNFKGSWENYTTTPFLETDWYWAVNWNHAESIQIVNHALLKTWWFESDYGDAFLPRTDNADKNVNSPMDIAGLIPKRELVRHYDGYSHVKADLNRNPPLFIPPGFFENDIKINYCSDSYKTGYVNVSPFAQYYFNVHHTGVDLRCSLEDLPLFWRSRISKVEGGEGVNSDALIAARNSRKYETSSEFLPAPREAILSRFAVSFRADSNGQVQFGEGFLPGKSLQYYSILKHSQRRPKLSVIILERRLGVTGRNCLGSLLRQSGARDDFEVIVVGLHGQHDPEMLAYADTYITIHDNLNALNNTYSIPFALNIAASFSNGPLLCFSDDYCLFPANFTNTVISTASSLIEARRKFCLWTPEEQITPEGFIGVFQQPVSTLVVSADDFINIGGFDEAPTEIGEKFAATRLASRLKLAGCTEFSLPLPATTWRITNQQYRLIAPNKMGVSAAPVMCAPEFRRFLQGEIPVSDRSGTAPSQLEQVNAMLLVGKFDVLRAIDRRNSSPEAALVLAALNDQLSGIDRGEFERLEAAAEKATNLRADLAASVALLLFFRKLYPAVEQWVQHGLSGNPLKSLLWLIRLETKSASGASKQDVLSIALEGLRNFPLQEIFLQRALQCL